MIVSSRYDNLSRNQGLTSWVEAKPRENEFKTACFKLSQLTTSDIFHPSRPALLRPSEQHQMPHTMAAGLVQTTTMSCVGCDVFCSCLLFGSLLFCWCTSSSNFPRKRMLHFDCLDLVSKNRLYLLLHLIDNWVVHSFFPPRILKALLNFLLVPKFLFMTLMLIQFLNFYMNTVSFLSISSFDLPFVSAL